MGDVTTAELVEVIEHLDFPAVCGDDYCDRPADFSGHCRHCAATRLICGPCLNRVLEIDTRCKGWVCMTCGEHGHRFLQMFEIRPFR